MGSVISPSERDATVVSSQALVSHTAAHLLARLHALAARFRAYAAVFVPARVPLAFIAAQATRRRAGDEHPTNELVIRAGAPGGDASRDIADIGAVEIEPDALGQLLDHSSARQASAQEVHVWAQE
jgi:hypothetical protein